MKSFKIFLASSSELKEDRDAFRIFLSVENDRLHRKDIYQGETYIHDSTT